MFFEGITENLGWWAGLALVAALILGVYAMAGLAPVPVEGNAPPAGLNPGAWQQMSMLATAQSSPWSMGMMAANRIPGIATASIAGFSLLSLAWLGYSWRQQLQAEIVSVRGAQQAALGAENAARRETELARADARRLEGERDAERRRADMLAQQIAERERSQTTLTVEAQRNMATLNSEIRSLGERAQRCETEKKDAIDIYNEYLRNFARDLRAACPTTELPPRPEGMPVDPRLPPAPRPPGPPPRR